MPKTKFVYQLQKILDFRIRKEDQLKAELASAIRKRDVEVAALNALNEKRIKAQKSLEMYLARGEVTEVQYTNAFLQSLSGKIAKQNLVVNKANTNVEEIRKKLTIASKERKIMEKHKEKKYEEWKEEMKKWEAKQIDEMASNIVRSTAKQKIEEEEEAQRYIERMEKLKLLRELQIKKEKERKGEFW